MLINRKASIATAIALFTLLIDILRLNISVSSFLVSALFKEANSNAMVVVLIPPAVLDGEPPTYIKKQSIANDTKCRSAKAILPNPAVLAVTDKK